jgi:Flp pilus assembly protein TadD
LFSENIQAAEYSLLKNIQLLPENWKGYNRLGYVYEKKGNYRKALQNYQKAQDLSPNSQVEQSLSRIRERIRREMESG